VSQALTKPWIFDEFARGTAWEPSAAERVSVYRRLACYMKEHFRDDEKGRKRAEYFLVSRGHSLLCPAACRWRGRWWSAPARRGGSARV
jgi:hypothetical protein